MAGAVCGEVKVSLFVAGAAFREIWNDSRSAKCCIFFNRKCSWSARKVSSLGRRVAEWRFHGLWSDHARIGPALYMTFQVFWRNLCEMLESHFAWRRSIRWCWRMTPVIPRIVNNVTYVTRINFDSCFAWQAQYSMKFGMIVRARRVVFFNTICR